MHRTYKNRISKYMHLEIRSSDIHGDFQIHVCCLCPKRIIDNHCLLAEPKSGLHVRKEFHKQTYLKHRKQLTFFHNVVPLHFLQNFSQLSVRKCFHRSTPHFQHLLCMS